MREILFRGKDVDNGEWVEGYLTVTNFPSGKWEKCIDYMIDKDTIYEDYGQATVIPETVGQYTGLTDKNKTKIFEGDIIKFGINQRLMYVHWNEETLTWELTDVGVPACEVNHLSNTFELGEIQVESAYGEMFSEVVGSIYD
jgi:uncharacterized phage protein (TIGR01671 family)